MNSRPPQQRIEPVLPHVKTLAEQKADFTAEGAPSPVLPESFMIENLTEKPPGAHEVVMAR